MPSACAQGKAGAAATSAFKGGDASKQLEAVQAQMADVSKQLAASKRTLAEMQVQLSAKSELYEKVRNRVPPQTKRISKPARVKNSSAAVSVSCWVHASEGESLGACDGTCVLDQHWGPATALLTERNSDPPPCSLEACV